MKKLFIVVAAIGLMYSCGGNTQKSQEQTPDKSAQVADEHNSQNSLDYAGTYIGKLPTAGGEGMIVTIELGDSTFVRKTEYAGKEDKSLEEKGKYSWSTEGSTIILEAGKDSPNQYLVGENILIQLDMEGNKITGDMADLYILKKQ
jgi:uncharacterized lipoprotein NlpE involved in copper resistance